MAVAMNRYPLWKYILIVVVIVAAFIYAFPNLYGESPAVQIAGVSSTIPINQDTLTTVNAALKNAGLSTEKVQIQERALLLIFSSTDEQLKAKEVIQETLGDNYLVAINLAPATPNWLKSLGATPMKLGLDLRGGVHFLLQVDVNSVLQQRMEGDLRNVAQGLRDEHIRYSGISRRGDNGVVLQFRTADSQDAAFSYVSRHFPEFTWERQSPADNFIVQGSITPLAQQQIRQETIEKEMDKLRNRVNELGISEAIVQQQGESRVSVDLPGVQDTAQAKSILGNTTTLEFHIVDTEHDPSVLALEGVAPPDTKFYSYHGQPILVKSQVVLRGSSIVGARSGFGEDGRPNVEVRLGGGGDSLFTRTTAENIGKPMAAISIEVKSAPKMVNGVQEISYKTEQQVISVATIQSTLGNNFQITGLAGAEEAKTLALLLRAGALPAPVTIIEERQVGPSLGKQNIHMGVLSVEVGTALIVLFMVLYYSLMGVIADVALLLNLVLIVAVQSLLGATLTLPGIAAIVLTMGMAVDANVLIFERIREELRRGLSVQASIYAGYEKAFVTIVDANLTTLIVAMVLFSLGSGAVKGFAITLTIGLLTSMFTAITVTRAIVNWLYGRRTVKHISIGMA